jgi:hypothetical protein
MGAPIVQKNSQSAKMAPRKTRSNGMMKSTPELLHLDSWAGNHRAVAGLVVQVDTAYTPYLVATSGRSNVPDDDDDDDAVEPTQVYDQSSISQADSDEEEEDEPEGACCWLIFRV